MFFQAVIGDYSENRKYFIGTRSRKFIDKLLELCKIKQHIQAFER